MATVERMLIMLFVEANLSQSLLFIHKLSYWPTGVASFENLLFFLLNIIRLFLITLPLFFLSLILIRLSSLVTLKGIYAEVVNIWGRVVRLRIASYTYNDEFTQLRNKTLMMFFKVLCLHLFILRIKIIQQKCKASGFQNKCFFFNLLQVTPRLKLWAC